MGPYVFLRVVSGLTIGVLGVIRAGTIWVTRVISVNRVGTIWVKIRGARGL
jgi:hypothetical protein